MTQILAVQFDEIRHKWQPNGDEDWLLQRQFNFVRVVTATTALLMMSLFCAIDKTGDVEQTGAKHLKIVITKSQDLIV